MTKSLLSTQEMFFGYLWAITKDELTLPDSVWIRDGWKVSNSEIVVGRGFFENAKKMFYLQKPDVDKEIKQSELFILSKGFILTLTEDYAILKDVREEESKPTAMDFLFTESPHEDAVVRVPYTWNNVAQYLWWEDIDLVGISHAKKYRGMKTVEGRCGLDLFKAHAIKAFFPNWIWNHEDGQEYWISEEYDKMALYAYCEECGNYFINDPREIVGGICTKCRALISVEDYVTCAKNSPEIIKAPLDYYMREGLEYLGFCEADEIDDWHPKIFMRIKDNQPNSKLFYVKPRENLFEIFPGAKPLTVKLSKNPYEGYDIEQFEKELMEITKEGAHCVFADWMKECFDYTALYIPFSEFKKKVFIFSGIYLNLEEQVLSPHQKWANLMFLKFLLTGDINGQFYDEFHLESGLPIKKLKTIFVSYYDELFTDEGEPDLKDFNPHTYYRVTFYVKELWDNFDGMDLNPIFKDERVIVSTGFSDYQLLAGVKGTYFICKHLRTGKEERIYWEPNKMVMVWVKQEEAI